MDLAQRMSVTDRTPLPQTFRITFTHLIKLIRTIIRLKIHVNLSWNNQIRNVCSRSEKQFISPGGSGERV